MAVRDQFEDVCLLRKVHRHNEKKDGLSDAEQEKYRQDADRYRRVVMGMADCDPALFTKDDHAWLSGFNRSVLQQTEAGRRHLRVVDGSEGGKPAPLLMDGRKDTINGAMGATKINVMKLERVSAAMKKPILPLRAYHDKPKKGDSSKVKADQMDADDFRGIVNELLVCEGARVLLTQNLWVEAGLMNGALGHVVGYMWPEGGDPHSDDAELRSPLCVFVEFDDVNLGGRSFFPDDARRKNWVPIFRQKVSSTVQENVYRENYPLQLAWAMTHWKAQGMTLDRVRIHLSERSAAIPGIALVACTRVRHPWDLVFEEDLPAYEHFMRARRTPAFRARKRYELRCEARASRTLRRYGFCEADKWTEREAADARDLLDVLAAVAGRRRKDMERAGRRVDQDTWLWGDVEPDYEGELVKAVERLGAGDAMRKAVLEKVAERLLDRKCVRVTTAVESVHARDLLEGVDVAAAGNLSEEAWLEILRQRADMLESSDSTRNGALRGVARGVASCLVRCGEWADEVEDELPPQVDWLHMSAVKEALGALIPARLHRTLDEDVKKGKDTFGVLPGGASLRMDDWKVNVRGEDALARGSLSEDVLEFFLKVLRHVLRVLEVPVAIASKTVGKEIGVQETPERMHRVFSKWAAVWDRADVRKRKELLFFRCCR